MDSLLKTIQNALFLGSEIGRRVQGSINLQAITKSDRSPVTVADLAIQAALVIQLRETDPSFAIVAEEDLTEVTGEAGVRVLGEVTSLVSSAINGVSEEDVLDALGSRLVNPQPDDSYWILDPIDGTKGFLRGDQYAIALGRYERGEIVAGGLGCPNLQVGEANGVVCIARRGEQAWYAENTATPKKPLRVSARKDTAALILCESVEAGHSSHAWSGRLISRLGLEQPPLRIDSQCKYAAVAAGLADVYLRLPTRQGYVEKAWDHAGGIAVVEAAGGRVTDIHGRAVSFRHGAYLTENEGLVVTNGPCHEAILEAVQAAR